MFNDGVEFVPTPLSQKPWGRRHIPTDPPDPSDPTDRSDVDSPFTFRIGDTPPELLSGRLPFPGSPQHHRATALWTAGNPISQIGPIRPIFPTPFAFGEPRGSQLFAVAAFLNELLFDRLELLVEQIIGLMDQTNEGVRTDRGILMIEPTSVKGIITLIRKARRRLIPIRRIGPIRPIHPMPSPNIAHFKRLSGVLRPLPQPSMPQKVFVIQQQFLLTRARHVHQPQFGLG